MKAYGLAETSLGAAPPKVEAPPKVLKHMLHRKATKGGFIVEHHHTMPEAHPMEEHAVPDLPGLHDHMDEAYGDE